MDFSLHSRAATDTIFLRLSSMAVKGGSWAHCCDQTLSHMCCLLFTGT